MIVSQPIRVRPAHDSDFIGILQIVREQAARLYFADILPFVLDGPYTSDHLRRQIHERRPLVAVNEHDNVRGYVLPALWDLPEQSTLHAFLTRCNGIASALTLPDPKEEDAHTTMDALLHGLTAFWREQDTTGDLIRW